MRGAGFFYALELVKDKETRETFSDEECETLLRGFLSPRLFERGLICRADDRGDPVIQISPPLVAGQAEFDEIVGILGDVLAEAGERMHEHHRDAAGRERRREPAGTFDIRLIGLTKRFARTSSRSTRCRSTSSAATSSRCSARPAAARRRRCG